MQINGVRAELFPQASSEATQPRSARVNLARVPATRLALAEEGTGTQPPPIDELL